MSQSKLRQNSNLSLKSCEERMESWGKLCLLQSISSPKLRSHTILLCPSQATQSKPMDQEVWWRSATPARLLSVLGCVRFGRAVSLLPGDLSQGKLHLKRIKSFNIIIHK